MAFVRAQQKSTDDHSGEADAGRVSLLLDLNHDSPTTRRWAARDLCRFPDVAAAMVTRLKRETDLSVREVILTTLTRIGDSQAVSGLVDCLRSEDAALRNEAIEAMQRLPIEVGPLMQGLLKDTDTDVRIFAVNILESLRHPDVEAWLIDVVETDSHVNVCAAAVDLLSEIGTPAAYTALLALKARFRDEPYIEFATDLSLRRIDEK